MNPFSKTMDRWLGRGEASITTPPMDGAFRPNDLLDSASSVFETPAPDDLAVTSHGVVVSSQQSLFRVDKAGGPSIASFAAPISAIAGLPDGGAAVALIDGRIVFLGGQHEGKTIEARADVTCITALAAAADGTLFVANGSATNRPADWKRDLMEKNATGSVWRLEPGKGTYTRLAAGLAYPHGLVEEADSLVVAESWRSALTRIAPSGGGGNTPVLGDLAAYPARLSRDVDGGIWLALFAPRNPLVEFVLSEDRYRQRMISEIEVDYWVAPSLRAGRLPLEPLQQGGAIQFGALNPWSPTRSYGLVAHLDYAYRPTASFHSRASGHRHGVTSCLAFEGRLFFSAKGDGVVASLPLGGSMS